MRIGELARKTGVTRATIHHYVKEGLLPEPVKSSPNMALYHPDCVERVLLVKSLQQEHRRSLAEVKQLLDAADQNQGLARLKAQLEAEIGVPELDPDRPTEPLTQAQLIERTGFSAREIARFHKLGAIAVTGDGRYAPLDVDVLDALARLFRMGFTDDAGFRADDVAIYVEGMRELIRREAELFLSRAGAGDDPDDLIELARIGLEAVTPLMLAIRRKQLRELVEGIPTKKS